MLLPDDIKKGLEILTPFLTTHDFELDSFLSGKDLKDDFAIVSFKKERKKFIIDYRFSIGQALYKFDNSIISHPFYLNQLGFENRRWHKDFLSDQRLEGFKQILHDFEFVVDDFFKGECNKLKEFAELEKSVTSELDRNILIERGVRIDKVVIEKARQEFRIKELKMCLDSYSLVENVNLLLDLDKKIIEYCKRNI
jgi:hypothetical protein